MQTYHVNIIICDQMQVRQVGRRRRGDGRAPREMGTSNAIKYIAISA